MKALWLVVLLVLGSVLLNEAFPRSGKTSSSGGSRSSGRTSSYSSSRTSSGSQSSWFGSMFSGGSSKPSAPSYSSVYSRPSHSYPSSSGLSGFGSLSRTHTYPQSSGLSGTSSSRHSYPPSSGLSGNSRTSSTSHSYPPSSGLSGTSNSKTSSTSSHWYSPSSWFSGNSRTRTYPSRTSDSYSRNYGYSDNYEPSHYNTANYGYQSRVTNEGLDAALREMRSWPKFGSRLSGVADIGSPRKTEGTGTGSRGHPQSTGVSQTSHTYPQSTGLSGAARSEPLGSNKKSPSVMGNQNSGFGSSRGTPSSGNYGRSSAATGIGNTPVQNSQSGVNGPVYASHNTPTNNQFPHPPSAYIPIHSFSQSVPYQPSYAIPYQKSSTSDDLLKGLMIWNLARSATHSGHHYDGIHYNNYDNPASRNNYETHNTYITNITHTINTGSVDKNTAPVNMANCTLTINAVTDPELFKIPCDTVSSFSADFNTTNSTKYDKLIDENDKSCILSFSSDHNVTTKYFPCEILKKASMDEPVVGKLNCTQDPRTMTQEMDYSPCIMADNVPLPEEFGVLPKEKSEPLPLVTTETSTVESTTAFIILKGDETTTVEPISNVTATKKSEKTDESSTAEIILETATVKNEESDLKDEGLGDVHIDPGTSDTSTAKSAKNVESVGIPVIDAIETTTSKILENTKSHPLTHITNFEYLPSIAEELE